MSLRLPAHWREEAALAVAIAASEATPSIHPHRLPSNFSNRQICFRSNLFAHPKSPKSNYPSPKRPKSQFRPGVQGIASVVPPSQTHTCNTILQAQILPCKLVLQSWVCACPPFGGRRPDGGSHQADEATPSIHPHRLPPNFGNRQSCFRSNPIV